MNRQEIIERLKGYEWKDIEFKRARTEVPKTAYQTVSAFANTEGGSLVFGIEEGAGGFEIIGVVEVDKLQNDFLTALRSGQKLSCVIVPEAELSADDGRAVLAFRIPEVRREDKPVYLNGDIRNTFVRRGACDERCTQLEIRRFLRDAGEQTYDSEALDLDPERCFDDESVSWYRAVYRNRRPGQDEELSNLEFLRRWGLVVEASERVTPTHAAVLLFGTDAAFRQTLPRPVVDMQWSYRAGPADSPDERWADRLTIENNLVKTWRALLDRYIQHAETPFAIDPDTLRRDDRPPDYIAFREAAINLLIHQDYADHNRTPIIVFSRDCTRFWNPGNAFVSGDELFEPGERHVRNPRIVGAFRRIGLSEQAGTGMWTIFGEWRRLGRVPPVMNNDKADNGFALKLLSEPLLSEEQLLFQTQLGVRLNEAEARAFALARRERRLCLRDVWAVTGLSGTKARAVLEHLVRQRLVTPLGGANATVFVVADHLADPPVATDGVHGEPEASGYEVVDRPGSRPPGSITDQAGAPTSRLGTDRPKTPSASLITDQVGMPTGESGVDQDRAFRSLSATQWRIANYCDVPRSMAAIMTELGMTHRSFFRQTHFDPLLRAGVIRMMHPDRPNHPKQAYVLTDAGVALTTRRHSGRADTDDDAAR